MRQAPTFQLLGFPVHIRPGFGVFLLLVVMINPGALGLWMAAFVFAFTLVHELGHAVAARATGARAEIALDFMAGYASFVPSRTLTRIERAGISFAGPATQIMLGGVAYLAVRGAFAWPTGDDAVEIAVLWAGPMIGAFNLLPVLPFDGGNIVEQLVAVFAPRRARLMMMWFTGAVMVGLLAASAFVEVLQPFAIFMIVPLLSVAQLAGARRAATGRVDTQTALARAEAMAWATGSVDRFPPGSVPSPWFRAHQQLTHGHADIAREILLHDLRDSSRTAWWPPDAAPLDALGSLLDLLPRPLPTGRPFSAYVLSGVLLRTRRYEDAAHYAAVVHAENGEPVMALQVARAAAALDDRPTAIGWLRAMSSSTGSLLVALDAAPELAPLRDDPEVAALLHSGRD